LEDKENKDENGLGKNQQLWDLGLNEVDMESMELVKEKVACYNIFFVTNL
jgi:hypothetical protein